MEYHYYLLKKKYNNNKQLLIPSLPKTGKNVMNKITEINEGNY